MKHRLSYKDLLIVLGIVVAVIIAITTLSHSESSSEANQIAPAPKKTGALNLPAAVRKLTERTVAASRLPIK